MTDRISFLRRLPYFAGLPDDILTGICERSTERELEAGEVLITEGSESDAIYVVMTGDFEVLRRSSDREVSLGTVGPGEVIGEISLLEGTHRMATVRAQSAARVLHIGRRSFDEVLRSPDAVLAMLRTVVTRLRQTEAAMREVEKLAALGTMAAGLMHEVNNPAAAVRREAETIAETLDAYGNAWAELVETTGVTIPESSGATPDDIMERSDREDEVALLLEDLGFDDAWMLAQPLVEAGWDATTLSAAVEGAEAVSGPMVRIIGHRHALERHTTDLRMAAERVTDLVGAVKRYAHVGEAPVGEVDVHASIRDTLTILRGKLADVEVTVEVPDDLPKIEANGTALNQVWTNLIDNAAAAMKGEGSIAIGASADADHLVVKVTDSGPGIPPEVRERIFEPFFTTKEPGDGTGLGLHTVYEIVSRQGGMIDVKSRPGETTFRVSLPLRHASP